MTDDDPVVLVEVEDRCATVTLNRPAVRNALSRRLRAAIPDALGDLAGRDDVDVVILTGADPAFCAGVDLAELGSGRDLEPAGGNVSGNRGPWAPVGKPVIGAVNGPAVTGGLELALNCDFLIASERARFADTHARVGIQPGWGLTVLLSEAVGLRRAREMSATGNFVDAGTALAWGLVNHVVPHDELMPTCRRLAADIVTNDQAALRRLYRTYTEGSEGTGADFWALEAAVSDAWMAETVSTDEVERRRRRIVERGRTQNR